MKKREFTVLLLVTATILSLAACGGGTKDAGSADGGTDAARKDTFTLADGEWYGTDLYQQDSWSSGQTLIADVLFTLDQEGGDLLDGICTDLTASEDGLTLTMTVPEGKYYATGEQAVSYGMYSVESCEPGSGVTLAANEGYKTDNPLVENKGAPASKTLIKFNMENFTVIEELKAGNID